MTNSRLSDSIYEIVAFYFGTENVAQVLQYMPSHFVAHKLIVCGASTFDILKIKLSEIHFPLLADRMYSDIKDMHLFDVFRNTSLDNIHFLYEYSYTHTILRILTTITFPLFF